MSAETQALYARAADELTALGAILVDDPFLGSGFAALRRTVTPQSNFDARGLESVPDDLHQYLDRLGPNAALKRFAEFAKATASDLAFGPNGVLGYMHHPPPAPVRGLPAGAHGAARPV